MNHVVDMCYKHICNTAFQTLYYHKITNCIVYSYYSQYCNDAGRGFSVTGSIYQNLIKEING